MKVKVPSLLSVMVPLEADKLLTDRVSPSTSPALESRSLARMVTELSSAPLPRVTSAVVGPSLTEAISKLAVPAVEPPWPSLMV